MIGLFDTWADFESNWLVESSKGTSPRDYSRTIDQNIHDIIQSTKDIGKPVIDLGNNLRKSERVA